MDALAAGSDVGPHESGTFAPAQAGQDQELGEREVAFLSGVPRCVQDLEQSGKLVRVEGAEPDLADPLRAAVVLRAPARQEHVEGAG